eukprot:m.157321 g.157321  ORF g.157321 m.157321 type:complete len:262 (-) comp52954_c0_seq1:73-858(-)
MLRWKLVLVVALVASLCAGASGAKAKKNVDRPAPVYSTSYPCLNLDHIDSSCIIGAAVDRLENFAFHSKDWDPLGFKEHLVQQAKFWTRFPPLAKEIARLCEGKIHEFTLGRFTDGMDYTVNTTSFARTYDLPNIDKYPTNKIVDDYLAHIESQKTCKDLISAYMPHICIYHNIANALQATLPREHKNLPRLVTTWINDNVNNGIACLDLQGILSEIATGVSRAAYQKSARFEMQMLEIRHSPSTQFVDPQDPEDDADEDL